MARWHKKYVRWGRKVNQSRRSYKSSRIYRKGYLRNKRKNTFKKSGNFSHARVTASRWRRATGRTHWRKR